MLFRSQNGEIIVNPSEYISISIRINRELDKYSIFAKFSDDDSDRSLLGEYKDYKSAQIAMNFIQNQNNSIYHNVRGWWELKDNCSEDVIIDMLSQTEIDKILKENG